MIRHVTTLVALRLAFPTTASAGLPLVVEDVASLARNRGTRWNTLHPSVLDAAAGAALSGDARRYLDVRVWPETPMSGD